MALDWRGLAALSAFTLQNGCAALLMRFAKTRTQPYSTAVAVLLQEVAVKLPISALLYAVECRGPLRMCRALVDDLRQKPREWLQLAVPALFYTIQNTMLYLGFANLNSAIGLITYQSKIPMTALCSVWLLGKRLSLNQWISLLVLVVGVVLAQEANTQPSKLAPPAAPPPLAMMPPAISPGQRFATTQANLSTSHTTNRYLAEGADSGADEGPPQSAIVGVIAFLVAAATSAFASVYFEKMIKSEGQPSLWLRNIQLAVHSSLIATVGLLLQQDSTMWELGLFHGFGLWTWITILWQSAGGIVVAVAIKYAGNILRCFAQGLAIVVAAIGSYIFFSFDVTTLFVCGVGLVIGAIFIYGDSSQTPDELCRKLLRTLRRDRTTLRPSPLTAPDEGEKLHPEEDNRHSGAAEVVADVEENIDPKDRLKEDNVDRETSALPKGTRKDGKYRSLR